MRVNYAQHVLDELFLARSTQGSGPEPDVVITCSSRQLRAHSALLGAVSGLARERTGTHIAIPSEENFACYECVAKLLDALYAREVAQLDTGHEAHAENLLNFFKIVDYVRTFLRNSFISRIPNEGRVRSNESIISNKGSAKKYLKVKIPNKTISNKMLVCIECSYRCYKSTDMLEHILQTKHGKNVCSLCSLRSETSKQFEEHLKRHDNEKPFFCNTCDLRFHTRAFWSQHIPTHSSVAPFHCPHCPKRFKWKHGLNGHLVTHTKEMKHLCDECGFSTTHAKTLRAHKLTHSGDMFRCSHPGCSHTSLRKENMKIHLKTHNKEKPFVCEICGLNFTQNKNLQRHSLIHTQGKVPIIHSCLHCSFKAIRSDNLKAHMLRQHTEKPLNLELSDNFTDVIGTSEEQCMEINDKNNDLTVLADAASSCSRIEPTKLRNFDNLIANR